MSFKLTVEIRWGNRREHLSLDPKRLQAAVAENATTLPGITIVKGVLHETSLARRLPVQAMSQRGRLDLRGRRSHSLGQPRGAREG